MTDLHERYNKLKLSEPIVHMCETMWERGDFDSRLQMMLFMICELGESKKRLTDSYVDYVTR